MPEPVVTRVQGSLMVQGDLQVLGDILPALTRSALAQEDNAEFVIPFTAWRVWNAFDTNLPATPASDDLGLVGGAFATASPTIQAGDLKAAGATTRYARCTFALPHNYVSGQSVTIRAFAGMKTTTADDTCTIDFEAFKSDDMEGISADLVTTSATSMNSLTDADKDFAVTATSLVAGDVLDIRMAVTCTDASTVTAVIPVVGKVSVLLDVK